MCPPDHGWWCPRKQFRSDCMAAPIQLLWSISAGDPHYTHTQPVDECMAECTSALESTGISYADRTIPTRGTTSIGSTTVRLSAGLYNMQPTLLRPTTVAKDQVACPRTLLSVLDSTQRVESTDRTCARKKLHTRMLQRRRV